MLTKKLVLAVYIKSKHRCAKTATLIKLTQIAKCVPDVKYRTTKKETKCAINVIKNFSVQAVIVKCV